MRKNGVTLAHFTAFLVFMFINSNKSGSFDWKTYKILGIKLVDNDLRDLL